MPGVNQQHSATFRQGVLALWLMSRPSQLLAVALVYLIGVAVGRAMGYSASVAAAVWGLAALLLVAVSIHYANEYADAETDALTDRTPFSGGSGAMVRLGVSPRLAWRGAWAALAAGWLVAVVALVVGQLSGLALLVLAIGSLFGWMYSLPPLRLAWRGWGELTNALLGGLALALYGYAVAVGRIDAVVVWAILPFTLLVFVNLLATTWPDRTADAQVGKRTLATRWSVARLRGVYLVVAVAAVGLLWVLPLPAPVMQASLLVVPFLVWGGYAYTRQHSPLPTVAAMVVLAVATLAGWFWAGGWPS